MPNRHIVCISYLTGLGFFLKQFYIFKSGTLQIGDCVLLLATIVSIFTEKREKTSFDYPFLFFYASAIVINLIYSLVYHSFFYSILYLSFNALMIVCLFRPMLEQEGFLKCIQIALRLILITQIMLYVIGCGRWLEDTPRRYMGSFNDPNQYGFFVLCCTFIQYAIDVINHKKTNWIWIGLGVINIIISSSASMLVGMVSFLVSFFVFQTRDSKYNWKVIAIIASLLIIGLVFLISGKNFLVLLANSRISIISRLAEKVIKKTSSSSGIAMGFISDRALSPILIQPQFFLFGFGEGFFERFIGIAGSSIELHSTILALAYYYGIIPFSFLVYWVYSNIHMIRRDLFCVYIGLFFEAFTLVNHRQSMFWLIVVLASHQGAKRTISNDMLLEAE